MNALGEVGGLGGFTSHKLLWALTCFLQEIPSFKLGHGLELVLGRLSEFWVSDIATGRILEAG